MPSPREPGPGAAQPTESAKDSGHYHQLFLNIELRKEKARSRRLSPCPSAAWPKPNVKKRVLINRARSGSVQGSHAMFGLTVRKDAEERPMLPQQGNSGREAWFHRQTEKPCRSGTQRPRTEKSARRLLCGYVMATYFCAYAYVCPKT